MKPGRPALQPQLLRKRQCSTKAIRGKAGDEPATKKAPGFRLKLLAAGEGFELESLHPPELF